MAKNKNGAKPRLVLHTMQIDAPPELPKATEKPSGLKRGVWATTNSFPGTEVLRVIDRNGGQLMRVEVVAELCDHDFVSELEAWLDKHDPGVPTLTIHRGDP